MQAIQQNRRLVLIVLVALMLLCLVGVLIYNIFVGSGGGEVATTEPPVVATEAPLVEATVEPTATAVVVVEEPTATPTAATDTETTESMVAGGGDETPEALPTSTTAIEESTPSVEESIATTAGQATPMVKMVQVSTIDEVLKNGDFEAGFSVNGVGENWGEFRTDSATINFSEETVALFVHSGDKAQRLSIDQARQADQYGGIFQTVELAPNEVYTLTLYGQIRSTLGSVEASSYGYRIQYALDQTGQQNWQNVTEWTELPWPEQSLDSSTVTFSEYTTQITPTSEKVTLFIRGWNKWPDAALAEYTVDSLSLVGPLPGGKMIAVPVSPAEAGAETTGAPSEPGGAVVDKGLPTTGEGEAIAFTQDPRFWGAAVMLLLLATGAVYRSKWRW
jgi:hypothetical protein